MKSLKTVSASLLVLVIVSFAQAAIIHVPGDYPTIQEGIDAAVDGDTVLVADGRYTGDGNRDLDFKGKTIAVTSENGAESTVIDCEESGRGFYLHSGETSESIVKGFTITNGSDDDGYIGAISCIESSPTIEGNIITGNLAGGIYSHVGSAPIIRNNIISDNWTADHGGGIYSAGSPALIYNNIVIGNRAGGDGGGICSLFSSVTISSNKISGNTAEGHGGGIRCQSGYTAIKNNLISGNSARDRGGAIFLNYYARAMIINNTITENSAGQKAGGIDIDASYPTERTTVMNTIVWRNKPEEVYMSTVSWLDITYSDIRGGWPGEGNIDIDPLFADAANGDYRLQDHSPCIGAGIMTSDVPDTDIEGNPRPNPPGSSPDMGAYENPLGVCAVSIETERTVSKGDSFFVIINVADANDLSGFQLDVTFDPTILDAVGVEEGTFLSDSGGTYWLEPNIDNTTAVITSIACAKAGKGGANGSGALATIMFKAIGAGETYIRLQNVSLSDSNGRSTPVISSDGSVTVTELLLPWDVNKDRRVDILDLVLAGQHFGEDVTTPLDPNPDVNSDGRVDVLDFALVGQHFGEIYSLAAPSRDIWSFDAKYLPVLVKVYNVMESIPNSDPDFLTTKRLLHRIIFSAKVSKTAVFQNYPNPFNPETWIPYQLAEDSEVSVRIYSVTGQLIRLLDLGYKEAGLYITKATSAYWDGTTDAGGRVSSGIYFYNIQAGSYSATRKMIAVQ
jgi:parallel beta-helix repeat protein